MAVEINHSSSTRAWPSISDLCCPPLCVGLSSVCLCVCVWMLALWARFNLSISHSPIALRLQSAPDAPLPTPGPSSHLPVWLRMLPGHLNPYCAVFFHVFCLLVLFPPLIFVCMCLSPPTTPHLPNYLHLPSIKLISLGINTLGFNSLIARLFCLLQW